MPGQQAGKFGDWFNYNINCKYNDDYIYEPFSRFQQEQVYGRIDFTYPVAAGDPVIQDIEDNPWYGMYMTTAEVNLYLAEFKLLGANLPGSAQDYFNKRFALLLRNTTVWLARIRSRITVRLTTMIQTRNLLIW